MSSVITFGQYELLAQLAEGGVAEIWLARQRGMMGFEKLVVLKRLLSKLSRDREYVDMFLDEARINARLQHTNVLQTYELGEIEGRYFLAMEYVEGLPLSVLVHKAVERLSDLPIHIAGAVLVQAARGLHYAHEATTVDGAPLGVVHRDLSPLNLLVGWDGVVKVADFGVALASGRRSRTKSGAIKGTPTYMSPEQVTGGKVDRRADVFGLGILLWELLTGQRLFRRDSVEETFDAITKDPIAPPSTYRPELPSSLDELTLRALARQPEDRFPTAEAFAEALTQTLHQETLRASAVDLRVFLEQHFAPERAEHEALLARVREGGQEAPLFAHAEHGLPTGEPPFSDGETTQDYALVRPAVPVAVPDASAIETVPQRALPKARRLDRATQILLAIGVLAILIALVFGVFLGRTQR